MEVSGKGRQGTVKNSFIVEGLWSGRGGVVDGRDGQLGREGPPHESVGEERTVHRTPSFRRPREVGSGGVLVSEQW